MLSLMKHDMTQGKILPTILLFTLPVIAGNLLQNFYSLVDTFLVGRFVSLNALAAIGSTSSICFLILGLAGGLTTGFGVIISQKFGARDHEGMKKAIAMSYLLSLVIGIFLTILTVLTADWLLEVMNTPKEIFEEASIYLKITFGAMLSAIGYNMLSTVLRAMGDSRTPLLLLLLSCVLNIIGDIVLITVVHWGVFGVAIATFLAQLLSAVACWIYLERKFPDLHLTRADYRPDRDLIAKLLKIGIPAALQFSVCALGCMAIQVKVNELGADIVAAFAVAAKVDGIMTTALPAIGTAITTYCGQNLGAMNFRRIKKGIHTAMLLNVVISVGLFFFALYCSDYIALLFVDASEVEIIENVRIYLSLSTMFYIPLGSIFVYRSGVQGLGSGSIPMISSAIELFARVAVAFTLADMIGYVGICIGNPASWTSGAIYCIIAFYIRLRKLEKQHADIAVA